MPNNDLRKKKEEFEQDNLTIYNETKEKARNEWTNFDKKFGKDSLTNLTLLSYSLGDPDSDSFSNWVEKKTSSVATISGGSAAMFYVWSEKKLYPTKFKQGMLGHHNTRIIDRSVAEIEFQKIKNTILKIILLAEKNDFKSIDELDLLSPVVKSKILYLYFPDKITSIMASTYVAEACKMMGVLFDDDHPMDSNHRLLANMKKNGEFNDWDSHKIGSFLLYLLAYRTQPSIFIAPRRREHKGAITESTDALEGYSWVDVEPYLNDDEKQKLEGRSRYHIWGNKGGRTQKQWRKMQKGDLILFYGDNIFYAAGKLYHKTHNKALADHLWDTDEDGRSWGYTFFVENLKTISIPLHLLKQLAPEVYSEGFRPQQFVEMNEKCLEKIHQEFGSVEGFLDKYSEPHILRELKAPITIQAPQKSMEQENPWNITPEMLNAELQHLYFDEPDSFFKNLCNLLNSGSNIILVGPPGTGKTEVALAVSKLAKKYVLGKDGICHVFSTATSDWTTFDTIGGYMPTKSNELEFKEGQFLRAIRDDKILVIDEINRAEIDKAFGQLFTVLSGQSVELQFLDANNLPIKLESSKEILNSFKKDNKYIIGSNWRILATMNTLDKAALYQMSYAFMRRFAFVHVDVPINKSECLKTINRQDNYDMDDALIQKIGILWDSISKSEQGKENPRQIGPAVFSSIIKLVKNSNVDPADEDKLDKILASAIIAFVLPQFEGATVETELKPLAKSLKKYEKHLARFFEEMFGEDFGNLTR